MIGDILVERYKITSRLGEGGMGEVYLADDEKTGRPVAVKILARQLTAHPEALERFRREAKTLEQLDHPNIVRYVDAFDHEGQYVIVMEYVTGGSLFDLLKKGPLPIERACQIALDLCDALIRAHRLNIIHRDIKPENVLMDKNGIPKLADFGVARLSEGTRMTRSGAQVGTPYYMAPEAWEGKKLDAKADIWSLGAVLFEMLSGQIPFDGDTPLTVMNKVFTSELPDLRKLRREVPPVLATIVRRMLKRDVQKRYKTMRQVAVDLESGEQVLTPQPARSASIDMPKLKIVFGQRRNLVFTGVLLLGVLIFILGYMVVGNFQPQLASRTPTEDSVSGAPGQAVTSAAGADTTVSVSPTPLDGNPATTVSPADGMILLLVQAGEFTMGSNTGEADEEPVHNVYLDAFWIDQTEVTNEMFARFVDETSYVTDMEKLEYSFVYQGDDSWQEVNGAAWHAPRGPNSDISGIGDHPVVHVSWNDAREYCEWAGRRLSTEAEWEKAASWNELNQTRQVFPSGDAIDCSAVNYRHDSEFCVGALTPVGSYPGGASPYGVLGMAGNALEWVADWYDESYYSNSADSNPLGPDSGEEKVIRGGSWFFNADGVRSANRDSNHPAFSSDDFGFRCAMAAE